MYCGRRQGIISVTEHWAAYIGLIMHSGRGEVLSGITTHEEEDGKKPWTDAI
jgi:hypothetical protein